MTIEQIKVWTVFSSKGIPNTHQVLGVILMIDFAIGHCPLTSPNSSIPQHFCFVFEFRFAESWHHLLYWMIDQIHKTVFQLYDPTSYYILGMERKPFLCMSRLPICDAGPPTWATGPPIWGTRPPMRMQGWESV